MAMRWYRMLVSALSATVLVIGLLAIGLYFFYSPQETGGAEALHWFEIDYLTPEEAAVLLGEPPPTELPASANEEATPR